VPEQATPGVRAPFGENEVPPCSPGPGLDPSGNRPAGVGGNLGGNPGGKCIMGCYIDNNARRACRLPARPTTKPSPGLSASAAALATTELFAMGHGQHPLSLSTHRPPRIIGPAPPKRITTTATPAGNLLCRKLHHISGPPDSPP
jgi:hypothetical protein